MISKDSFSKNRGEMVDRQLKARGISDPEVLADMGRIPRHLFVEKAFLDRSYDDTPLPIADRQTISQPYIVAFMVEALGLTGKKKVLEIGTGSGYQTAILAGLADRVFSIERSLKLGRQAEGRLSDMGFHNVLVRIADGTHGWAEEAPFDAIVVSAAAPEVPQPLLRQLSKNGRLVIPVGNDDEQVVYRITKTARGLEKESLLPCRFVRLVGRFGWEGRA